MSENISESNLNKLLDKAVAQKIEAMKKEESATQQSKDNYQKLADKIDANIKSNHDHSGADDHLHDNGGEPKHVHATHSSDKTCKTCGEKDPDYNSDQATCTDCGSEVGTVKEIETGEITTCKNCGGHEAEHKSKGFSF